MLPAIVLSGGESSRMGVPKALLPDGGGAVFIVRIVDALLAAGLEDIVIVTGVHHDAIAGVVSASSFSRPPRFVRNPDPARGQLSSLLAGMAEVCRPDTEAIVVTLVDVPMVRPSTIARVIAAWRETRAPVVRPAVGPRHGHPVIFDRAVFEELRQAPLEGGARSVVRAHADTIVNVPVDDPGCIVDVDTPEEYQRLLRGGADPGRHRVLFPEDSSRK